MFFAGAFLIPGVGGANYRSFWVAMMSAVAMLGTALGSCSGTGCGLLDVFFLFFGVARSGLGGSFIHFS